MNHTKLHRLHRLADQHGVPTSTVDSAARSGHLKTYALACGLLTTTEQDFLTWMQTPRKRGPKPRVAN